MRMGRIEKWFMNRPHHNQNIIRRAEKLFSIVRMNEGQNFLEAGCGNGSVSGFVAQKYGFNVTGVYVDHDQIRKAKHHFNYILNVRFMETDVTRLPFQDREFDTVLSFGVMHHINNWLDAMEEIRRVLKPEGYFIYWDIMYSEWLIKVAKLFNHKYGITTLRELDLFMEKNHFSTLYSKLSKSHHYEAVYQKNGLK